MVHRGRSLSRLVTPFVAGAAVLGLSVGAIGIASTAAPARSTASSRATMSRLQFHDAMRQLWEEHITFTRLFIVSDVANNPDLQATTNRLLANQVDIGNAVKPFYGSKAGDQLTALLKQHILLAAKILNAAKQGNSQAVKRAEAAWYRNADQISKFLHDANPKHWSLKALEMMMHDHLSLTLTEAVDQLGGHYVESINTYDKVETEILGMADTLSNGIIAQFPGRFHRA